MKFGITEDEENSIAQNKESDIMMKVKKVGRS
jgi:hypothetical protein